MNYQTVRIVRHNFLEDESQALRARREELLTSDRIGLHVGVARLPANGADPVGELCIVVSLFVLQKAVVYAVRQEPSCRRKKCRIWSTVVNAFMCCVCTYLLNVDDGVQHA